ncbi:heterogeneous nuclear ribonucleoprotein U-like protein 2 isoform X2 [Malaya genurostris]|uniref:heterogeneous nuclear ribonucleoprotein U-like protein 2 isoform X2 n=1 Tax=Malaya genurostris TaxID=325434 RepID=UPI0026F3AE5C|nr:heterogeneous nuclear ribonucleoprotein U-like protein 2 isoform X2 [Malaya genurostris]
MDYNKMKVSDLKVELASRNLDTKGVKAVLVERLKEAIEKENENQEQSTPVTTAIKKTELGTPNQSTPARRSRRRSVTRSPSPVKGEISILESVSEEPEHIEATDVSSVPKKRRTGSINRSPSPVKTIDVKRLEVLEEESDPVAVIEKVGVPINETEPDSPEKFLTPTKQTIPTKHSTCSLTKTESITPTKSQTVVQTSPTVLSPVKPAIMSPTKSTASPTKIIATSTTITSSEMNPASKQTDLNEATVEPSVQEPSSKYSDESFVEDQSSGPQEDAVELTNKALTGEILETKNDVHTPENEKKPTTEEEGQKPVKRKSSSPTKESIKTPRPKTAQTPITFVAEENEPEIDDNRLTLSWFDSDLNMEIDDKTLDAARPLSEAALALIWAGARANMGVIKGKVAFEVLLTKYNETKKVTEEPVTNEFRVGWSTSKANLQLGEDKHSFSYGSVGSKANNCEFSDYGIVYKVNDVIGAYLDMDSNPCKIEYTVNNISQGVAFEFDSAELDGQPLFPHVCSKNIAFKVNFGHLGRSLLNDRDLLKKTEFDAKEKAPEEKVDDNIKQIVNKEIASSANPGESEETREANTSSQHPASEKSDISIREKSTETDDEATNNSQDPQCINPEFIYIDHVPKEHLVPGIHRPEGRQDCEVIFLIGLPGSGKSHWVENYLQTHPEKKFTVLGVGTLLDQMKILGKPRQPSNTNKWPRLVEQLSRSLNKLNDIASKRRRNFILDQQANVFASEQKRRLRGFGGYAARRAVVVVPDHDEYNRRFKIKNDTIGIDAQEGNIRTMKAHFYIPVLELGWFTEIIFAELDEEKSREEVKKLNDAGRKALLQGSNKSQQHRRGSNQRWNQGFGNNRYGGQNYQQGGYNTSRYNNTQHYSQHRNYRPGNGYGRRESGGFGGNRYGNNTDWTRNSGRYDNRYSNQGYHNNQSRRFDGNRNDYRGYNNASAWNQDSNSYGGYGSQGNDSQQWYSWWQQGGSGSDNSVQHANMQQYWSQYAQQQNYGNYPQSKSHGSGASKSK